MASGASSSNTSVKLNPMSVAIVITRPATSTQHTSHNMTILEIIKSELANNSSEIGITYSCGTTFTNDEYIIIKIGSKEYTRIEGDNLNPFIMALNEAIESLKAEFPNLHAKVEPKEFHFFYHGFNSMSTKKVPVAISNKDPKSEIQKTGIVTERYSQVGTTKVLEVIAAHPDYELYKRSGFAFRGAGECRTDLEGIKKLCNWACCLDIEVRDNEIHVNGFSCNDMW